MILFASTIAGAFCGLYVGTGSPLHNQGSEVVVARNADGTLVLTLAPDYEGALADFGLVIPVPAGTGDADVRVADPVALAHLGVYSAPRLVRYTCEDLYPYYWAGEWHDEGDPRFHGCAGGDIQIGCSSESYLLGSSSAYAQAEGVAVEERFVEGDYEISVLSAENSAGLLTYLGSEGYVLDASAATALQSYIDQGLQFLVAKVRLDEAGEAWLTPLQIDLPASSSVAVPIRLGTENAVGPQDVELYLLDAGGRGYVQNYPEVPLGTDCMPEGLDRASALPAYWAEVLDETFAGEPAAWTTVFAWHSAYACDPCPPEGQTFFEVDALELGFHDGYPLITRLHVRWEPDPGLEDLVIGFGQADAEVKIQATYILHDPLLEGDFPMCGDDVPRALDSLCPDAPRSTHGAAFGPAALLGAAWLAVRRLRR